MFLVEKEMHDRQPPPTTERDGWDRFGFLPSHASCQFKGGAIEPVPNYDDVWKWVQHHLYFENLLAQPSSSFEPGILFPPLSWRQQHDPRTDDLVSVVPGSEGPALLHRVPTSHYVRLDDVVAGAEREGSVGFVTNVIGFLYDAPTQFWDWWFDGPVSIGGKSLHPVPLVLQDFVSHAYATWRAWGPEPQQLMISLLNMHGRAPGHRWHWERFSWEYTVTDACYKVADTVCPGRFRRHGKAKGKRPKHGDRIKLMCREFGLPFGAEEDAWVNFAVCLRNELLHEARWSGAQPSTKGSDAAFRAPRFLHKLNQRLIVGLLDYRNGFLASGWLTLSNAHFDKMK
ncbi:MAG: hypothetical protein HYR72_03615 [Deltaproteobacteria bacterium]|nr:hypothetical protein [Deltaproteobacteria bacterium]MBI3388724.1 hypothetical protein [Deltaproteobacteria bacterium]